MSDSRFGLVFSTEKIFLFMATRVFVTDQHVKTQSESLLSCRIFRKTRASLGVGIIKSVFLNLVMLGTALRSTVIVSCKSRVF